MLQKNVYGSWVDTGRWFYAKSAPITAEIAPTMKTPGLVRPPLLAEVSVVVLVEVLVTVLVEVVKLERMGLAVVVEVSVTVLVGVFVTVLVRGGKLERMGLAELRTGP